jgi:imidazolonepropionase
MLIHSASQLLTISGGPQRGEHLGSLGIIPDGALLIRGDRIADVGKSVEMLKKYPDEERLNAAGSAVLPGFVDPHTHLVWAGDRAAEFEMRLQGKSYMEIMAAGGGIQSTVNATRAAPLGELSSQTKLRAADIFSMGTTTAEAKTGYGLELETELKQLQVLMELNATGPLEIRPTFLGAHAVPQEYKDDPNGYVDLICSQMLSAVLEYWQQNWKQQPLPFVDVFCETGAFDLAQSRKILTKAKTLGFPLKIHADEFENLGGASLAAELGAISADHLVKTSQTDIQRIADSNTAAVSLPCTPFGLVEEEYTPAADFIKAGAIFALASDLNPGTAWCGNMQFVIALACRTMHLTPAQAVAATTINAAAAIQMDREIGSIEPGKQADVLILNVDDYKHLAYRFGTNLVKTVIKKGKVYSSYRSC